MSSHNCIQGPRILRLEVDAAAAEADRRKLRADVIDKMDLVIAEVVGMADSSKSLVDELRADVEQIRRRLAEVDETIDKRSRAAFARIDELRVLLGAEGHA